MLLAFQAHLIMWVILLESTIWTAFMINFKLKLWQDDHIFEKLNSLSFPWVFQGILNFSPEQLKTEKLDECLLLPIMSHIFHFPWVFQVFSTKVQIFLSFPWDFHNFSNSLSFPGFPRFPGLWPPCMRRIAPGWTAHRMSIRSSPNQQHEYSYLSILFHQLPRLCSAWSQHAPPCFWLYWKGLKDFKEVPLHAPITWNTFQFKQKNMTNVACFHGHHFLCLKGI